MKITEWGGLLQTTVSFVVLMLLFSCRGPGQKPWPAHVITEGTDSSGEVLSMQLLKLKQGELPAVVVSRQDSDWISLYTRKKSSNDSVVWQETKIKAVSGIHDFQLWNAGTRDEPRPELVATCGLPSGQIVTAPVPQGDVTVSAEWKFKKIPVPVADWAAVHPGDFNNDGISDLVLAGRAENVETSSAPEMIWMSLPGDQRVAIQIGSSAAPRLLHGEDVEGDGDMDLFVVDSAPGAGRMGAYWLENPWPENPEVQWKRNFITLSALMPVGGMVVDFDGDRSRDLLLCLREIGKQNRLMCFKKVTAGAQVDWLPLPLPVNGKQGMLHHVAASDVNQDGLPDLVLGFKEASSPLEHLLWLRNSASEAEIPQWTRHVLSGRTGVAVQSMILSDVDGDGDEDIITSEKIGKILWYENLVGSRSTQ